MPGRRARPIPDLTRKQVNTLLSYTEKHVYFLHKKGLSNKQISEILGQAEATIRKYLQRIRGKAVNHQFVYKNETDNPGAEHALLTAQAIRELELAEIEDIMTNNGNPRLTANESYVISMASNGCSVRKTANAMKKSHQAIKNAKHRAKKKGHEPAQVVTLRVEVKSSFRGFSGRLLQGAREQTGLEIEELAKRTGIDKKNIRLYESEVLIPSKRNLYLICNEIGKNADDFVYGVSPKEELRCKLSDSHFIAMVAGNGDSVQRAINNAGPNDVLNKKRSAHRNKVMFYGLTGGRGGKIPVKLNRVQRQASKSYLEREQLKPAVTFDIIGNLNLADTLDADDLGSAIFIMTEFQRVTVSHMLTA